MNDNADDWVDWFVNKLIQNLSDQCHDQGLILDPVTKRRVALIVAEYLDARRHFIEEKAMQEFELGGDIGRYFERYGEGAAGELSNEIIASAKSYDRNHIQTGDFVTALISICPLPPIC